MTALWQAGARSAPRRALRSPAVTWRPQVRAVRQRLRFRETVRSDEFRSLVSLLASILLAWIHVASMHLASILAPARPQIRRSARMRPALRPISQAARNQVSARAPVRLMRPQALLRALPRTHRPARMRPVPRPKPPVAPDQLPLDPPPARPVAVGARPPVGARCRHAPPWGGPARSAPPGRPRSRCRRVAA